MDYKNEQQQSITYDKHREVEHGNYKIEENCKFWPYTTRKKVYEVIQLIVKGKI